MSRLAKSIFCISVLFLGLFLFDSRPLIANDKDNRQMIISKSIHEGMGVTDFYFDYQKKTATLSISLYKQKQKMQEIKIDKMEKPYSYGWYITDVNFDGYQDILILTDILGSHINHLYKLWLWNPEKNQYEECVEAVPRNLAIDRTNQLLLSRVTNTAASHTWEIHKFQGNKLVLIHELTIEAITSVKNYDKKYPPREFVERQNIGGQLVEVKRVTILTLEDYENTRDEIVERYYGPSSIWRLSDRRWFQSDYGAQMGITDKDGKEVKVGLEE